MKQETKEREANRRRRAYGAPVLTRFGSIAQMTLQHSLSFLSDKGNNSMAPFPS